MGREKEMNVTVKGIYNKSKIPPITFASEEMESQFALRLVNDLESTGRWRDFIFIDELGQEWTKKQFQKLTEEIEETPQNVTIYFDGSHRPGETFAGAGIAIYYTQNNKRFRIRSNEVFDYIEDNNEAEYCALLAAVKRLDELGVKHQKIMIKGDSQVVLKQLTGEWPCYEENLNKWLDRIEEQLKNLGLHFETMAVPRKDNEEAHRLATQALEGIEIDGQLELPKMG